jgi:tetratricopeptide (TPR) repeat protein
MSSPWRVLLLLFALCPCAHGQHLKSGMELFRQERYREALEEFEAAHREDPGNAAVENVLGITATKLGRIDEANRHYQAAIRLNPEYGSAHKNLGVNYLGEKQYLAAEKELRIALGLDETDPFPHYYLAKLYGATAREKEAVEQMAPAGSLVENDPELSFQLVKACLRLNRVDQALALAGTIERRSAFSVTQEFEIAVALNGKGLYPQAVERFRNIAAATPETWVNRYNLAIALLGAKQDKEAAVLLERLATERPRDANVLSLLGSAYEVAGDATKALDVYRKAVWAEPENPDHYLDYTRLLIDLNRYDESLEFVQRGLKAVQDPYALNVRLGSVQMMEGKYSEARESFGKAIEEHPEIVLGYVALAQAFLKERLDEEAEKLLAGARGKLPADFMLEYFHGLALSRLDRQEDAAAAFERAIRLNSKVTEAHFELGKSYLSLGRIEAAREEFERVIQSTPRHANAHYQLSRLYARLGNAAKAKEMADLTKQLKQEEREEGLAAQRARLERLRPVKAP